MSEQNNQLPWYPKKARPISPIGRTHMKKAIKNMFKTNIIEKSQQPWGENIALIQWKTDKKMEEKKQIKINKNLLEERHIYKYHMEYKEKDGKISR
jgi:hypothetical protein